MKTIIIYSSQTGFTKQYATWLAEDLGAELLTIVQAKKKSEEYFADADAIIYGGWAMGGRAYDRMKFPYKQLMKAFSSMMRKKKDATQDEKDMAEMISKSYDIADKKYIQPVVDYIKA